MIWKMLAASILIWAQAFSGAQARGFTVSDFGSVRNDAMCVNLGRLMFQEFGVEEIKTTEWTVNAYGVGNENIDAAIICSFGPDGQIRVSLVLHSWGDKAEDRRREAMPEKLREIWKAL